MARIHALPSIEIIRDLKGILDFYLWRGLPCVRAWPKYRPAKQTDASLAAALTFGAIVKAYALLANLALEAYREDALDQPRTARDIMVTGVYGNLHEANMTDFLDALIICRDSLVSLTALINALHSIGTDRLDVDVHASVLPPLAATTTNQGLIYGRLGIIDDLADALESNALDRLLVRGMDQLFSVSSPLGIRAVKADAHAVDFTLPSALVPPGELWVPTQVAAFNNTGASADIRLEAKVQAQVLWLTNTLNPALNDVVAWQGLLVLQENDLLYATFTGTNADDDLYLDVAGYRMTLET